jgi:hypothetical protein
VLAENPFLSISVELDPTNPISNTADLQLTFRERTVKIGFFLGSTQLPYPETFQLQSGRVLATAWWGAWNWVALLGLCTSSVLGLLASWWILATLYWPVCGMASFVFRRPSRPAQSWKLGASALLFGALIMTVNVALYALLIIRTPGFIAGFVLHLAMGWLGIPWGALHLPKRPEPPSKNPFEELESFKEPSEPVSRPVASHQLKPGASSRRSDNPFKG